MRIRVPQCRLFTSICTAHAAPTTSCRQIYQLRITRVESFAQLVNSLRIVQTQLLPPATNVPKPPHDFQNSLILEHTVANRAVFYCVHREAAGAKSANFGIKNRVGAHSSQCDRPVFTDIEPPAKSPYTSWLIDRSNYRTHERASTPVTSHLNAPHGGKLVDLQVSPSRAKEIKEQSRDWPSWDLTPLQLCDLEMLCNGSFSPLTGFMGKADYESVCGTMRLANGTLWTMPIT